MSNALSSLISFCKELYPGEEPVPLHAPRFIGQEKEFLAQCIDSTFVSYVGAFVGEFERLSAAAVGCQHAVAVVNGTAALQLALMAAGVRPGDLVLTQALTFVATANAIRHAGAEPAFVDVEMDTMGMSPAHLREFLVRRAHYDGKSCIDGPTGKRIGAIVPMHTFGHPVRIREILAIAAEFGLEVVEDAAEALGSTEHGIPAGRLGKVSILSFNGNKIITTGGGGMVVTDDAGLADWVSRISSTAKRKHPWEFFHDEVAFNLRLPNVNAAVGVAQMAHLSDFLENKRITAQAYLAFGETEGLSFFHERPGTRSNHWLNCLLVKDREEREAFLAGLNQAGVQARPVWTLMNKLPMFQASPAGDLTASQYFEDRVINLPSSYRRAAKA